jgi:superfamily II DNA or RNA helicase
MIGNPSTFAPGSRLLIRDEEWLVKSALPVNTGGTAVRVVGLSELVRNQEAVFLTKLDKIEELKPEKTTLIADDSPQYRRARLYLESLLRRTPATDDRIYLGHQGAINVAAYQLQPAQQALAALRPRILIADGVGLGKTIEVGILLSELIQRGRGERILVVAIKSMLAQFQEELWARFAIPVVRLDSVGLQRVRAKIPSNKNPFYYYNRVIISVDTLKNDAQYRHYLEQCHWDVIVIDECHNVANTGSQRNRLAGLLARTCDSLILTSATPHNGRPESFANLINMLEPTAIADNSDYTADEIQGLFVRRFKKDIEAEVAGHFSERQTRIIKTAASPAEEAFFSRLAQARFYTLRQGRHADALYRIGLLKGFLSSPAACLQTVHVRLRLIQRKIAKIKGEAPALLEAVAEDVPQLDDGPATSAGQIGLWRGEDEADPLDHLYEDQALLTELAELATAVTPAGFSKYRRLLSLLRELGVTARPDSPRLLIFSERLATLQFLQDNVCRELGVDESVVKQFHAGLPDTEQQHIVESFGKEDSPIRILLASDVASEGVNLHYYCHLLVHFDMPWSLITLEQRNGRIDRYGQHQPPVIHYLLTLSQDEIIRGDLRILDKLIEKEQEAHKNIGDAATILGLYNADEEEAHITKGVAEGRAPYLIVPDEPATDWLALLMAAGVEETPVQDAVGLTGQRFQLYENDLAFVRAAFEELGNGHNPLPLPEYHPTRPELTFQAPADLRRRCEFMPVEALPANWEFRLTTDRQQVMAAIRAARKQEGTWPQEHLLWELHPMMEWLLDRLLVRFGRHEAPLILAPRLGPQTVILLFQAIIANLRSQPVITDWIGVCLARGGGPGQILTLAQIMAETGFAAGLPNPQQPSQLQPMIQETLLPYGVKLVREQMKQRRQERANQLGDQLRHDLRNLMRWREATLRRLDAQQMTAVGAQAARVIRERDEVNKLFKQRQEWLNNTLKTVEEPYLRLALAFAGS